MTPLEGTDRAVAWGVRCRHQIRATAYTTLVLDGETDETEWEAIEEAARRVTHAGWWIDQRSSEPGDLTELLRAATEADRPTENPHF
ncbi:hypothetical protein ACH489_19770 [Streptomyces rubiginosohelvolus]|uniref:hypothetical protein n=1 Tax=Streptomyces rubiginosohelvolus TaxID=67362 RepID=UPI00379FDA70